MRKKSQDELGTLVTREMKVMLQDESLTKEQRFDILSCVMFDAPLKNTLMASFANSLKAGFAQINSSRYRAIEREREWRKNHERKRRNAGYIDDDGQPSSENNITTPCNSMPLHVTPCNSMSLHDGLKQNKTSNNISPYKPPKGGKRKVPKAVEPEDILKGGSAAATGSCRFMDAEGFCTNKKNQGGGFKCFGCELREPVGGGGVSEGTSAINAGDGVRTATLQELTNLLAGAIEATEAFAHMRVNRRNLMRHLLPIVKKNCAAEDCDESRTSDEQRKAFGKLWQLILAGLAAWTEKWKADGWQYAPGKITKWLADEKWLEKPRKKTAPAEGSGCGDCGAEIA